ncbi:hypothetical protein OESDEN_03976 [Oesophagostomum dentatum]|uniref:Uncharacterized protein n=1 Tax=Oesophagostomum dentatum TaxID=61180 RepID=A0A0B1TIZ8_OESDE|nr:hypothetical protein OESDEN_03976 [Oesophagostomum dentatum]
MRAKRSAKTPKISKPPKMMKVTPVTRDRYDLIDETKESPLGMVAKNLLRDIRRYKNKPDKDFKEWREVISEIRIEGNKIKQKEREKEMFKKRLRMYAKSMNEQGSDKDTLKKMNVFGDTNEAQMDDVMMKIRKEQSKATSYDKLLSAPIELIRGAVKLGMMMDGKNVSDFEKKNMKLVSPRFFPVVPEPNDEEDEIRVLSPSLFALHNEGKGIEKETSIGKALSIFGEKDNNAWLNFILETSGVNDALDSMKVCTVYSQKGLFKSSPHA